MRCVRLAAVTTSLTLGLCAGALSQDPSLDDLLGELSAGLNETTTTETVAADAAPVETSSGEGAGSSLDALLGEMETAGKQVAEPVFEAIEQPVAETVADDSGFTSFEEPVPSETVVDATPATDSEFFVTGEGAGEAPVVETPVENQPAVTSAPTDSAVDSARLMAQQEEVRRQAKEVQARDELEQGMAAYNQGNFEQAVKLLESASLNLPARPANEADIQSMKSALGDAYLNLAREKMEDDVSLARRNIDLALQIQPDNRKAQSLEKRITAREARVAEEQARPKPVLAQPQYADKFAQIDNLLREGRDLFDAQEYNDAEAAFERVLVLDEYNLEAMRFLRKLEETRLDIRSKEREATVAEMMANVRDTWNPPIRTDSVVPGATQPQTQIDALTSQQKLQKKMEGIVIPSIEFRQANIADVVNFLVDASVAGDPDGVGVNIILKLATGAESAPAPAAPAETSTGGFGDDFSDFGSSFEQPAEAAAPGASSVPAITLNLRRINLLDAIKYITEVADLRYRLEDNVVVITPANVVSGRVVTRMYPVQPSILDVIVEMPEATEEERGQGDFIGMGTQTATKRSDVKDFFERAGVPFPAGTSITYNQSISQLIVANSVENLETFERILSRLNVIPNQVEIEARFVEVNQENLEELGFQWLLTDNWEIAQKKGGLFPASTETIMMRSDSQGITKGNRFFGTDISTGAINPLSTVTKGAQSALGGIATFSSVLTNPELTFIINALSQKGNADLLSAPRVTTRSGVNAQIQVVKEIIYPTEFESEVITISREVPGGGTAEERFVTTTPGTFVTRETGVILNVTPTVGPDGYTIDLTMTPEVAELIDWIQYGSSYGKDLNGDPIFSNIPQPIFSSRKVTTSIVVWDGQTVVMGGLINEALNKYDDKIPFLGDIPLLGRLFRNEGELSEKRNLLIFVTARLVGPDGRPIQREEVELPVAETASAPAP